jgi:RNA polymerase sigma-70 factor (ECF subfamily)
MAGADAQVETFEGQRRYLLGLAFRMLGSHAEAEDAVQEAWLRWRDADRDDVENPRAYLSRTVTRLCLDRLKSAQANREVYVGPWLPEPLVEAEAFVQAGPEASSDYAEDLSNAFLLALERLSPLERAAFLLHDVFDAGFAEVADALGRSEAAVRQLASRARTRIREERPRFRPPPEHCERLTAAFLFAASTGDAAALKSLLADDARFVSDGGGRISAAGIPIMGAARITKAVIGFATKHPLPDDAQVRQVRINGGPGVLMATRSGEPIQTLAFEFDAGGRIAGIYVVRNPDKLRHLMPAPPATH